LRAVNGAPQCRHKRARRARAFALRTESERRFPSFLPQSLLQHSVRLSLVSNGAAQIAHALEIAGRTTLRRASLRQAVEQNLGGRPAFAGRTKLAPHGQAPIIAPTPQDV
jgi:hypothetical protein